MLHHILRTMTDESLNVLNGGVEQADASFTGCPCNVWGDVGIGLVDRASAMSAPLPST